MNTHVPCLVDGWRHGKDSVSLVHDDTGVEASKGYSIVELTSGRKTNAPFHERTPDCLVDYLLAWLMLRRQLGKFGPETPAIPALSP